MINFSLQLIFSSGSFPEVIAILAFLCDLVRDIKKCQTIEMPLIPCDKLINNDFMALFIHEVNLNYYDLYIKDDKDDKDDPSPKPPNTAELNDELNLNKESEKKLVNGFIAAKTKQPGLTIGGLAAKTDQLKAKSEALEQKLVASDCEKYFNSIEDQLAEKEREYVKMQEVLCEKRNISKMVTITWDNKKRMVAAGQARIKNLERQIANQPYTTLDIKQLVAKEKTIKSSISMIESETRSIESQATDTQVKLARLHKLKLDGIQKFNEFTFHVTKILMQSPTFQQLNVIDFTIDPTASGETIQNMCLRLNRLNEKCMLVKREQMEQIEQYKATLAEYKAQYNQLKQKYGEQKTKMQNANKKLEMLNQKRDNCELKGTSSAAKLERAIRNKIATKQRIDEEIAGLRKKISELEVKNVQLFEDGERQAFEIIHAKQKLCRELDELNNQIEDATFEI